MKIHYVTTKLPNLWSGSQIRNYYLMRAASRMNGWEVRIHYIGDEVPNSSNVPEELLQKIVHYPLLEQGNYLKDLLQLKIPYIEKLKRNEMNTKKVILEGDIIQFQELDSYLATTAIQDLWKGIKIFDDHNIDYLRLRSELAADSKLKTLLGWPWLEKYKEAEIDALKNSNFILACSDDDKAYFSQYVVKEKVIMIRNGVDIDYFQEKKNEEESVSKIFFMGNLSYPANDAGLFRYVTKVHHKVLKKFPDLELVIVGKNPPKWLNAYTDTFNLNLTGFVKDVRDYMNSNYIGICPVYEGAGTRLKIVEYLACKMAVVTTSKGCEGLGVEDENQLMIADEDQEFANKISLLLSDQKLRGKYGNSGFDYVKKFYDWNQIGDEFVNFYKSIKA